VEETTNLYTNYLNNTKQGKAILPRDTRYSVGDALEYLNDGLNFLYCRPNDYFLETMVFLDTFAIPVSSGQIDEGDLMDLMDNIAVFAGDHYYADAREEKEPLMFDVNQISGPSPSYVYFQAIFFYEADVPLDLDDTYPYENAFIYGQYSVDVTNLCNDLDVNLDAADLFRHDLRENVVYRYKNLHYYFKDPYYVCFNPGLGCDLSPKFRTVSLVSNPNLKILKNDT